MAKHTFRRRNLAIATFIVGKGETTCLVGSTCIKLFCDFIDLIFNFLELLTEIFHKDANPGPSHFYLFLFLGGSKSTSCCFIRRISHADGTKYAVSVSKSRHAA